MKIFILKTGRRGQGHQLQNMTVTHSVNTKACQTTQHYSEIILGPKLIVALSRNIVSETLVNTDSGNGLLHGGTIIWNKCGLIDQ